MSAYDSGNPEIISSESIQVNVLRNLFAPVISPSQYSKNIYDFQPVGSSVFRVTASDNDITSPENTFTFKIAEDSVASEFFTIDPFSGLVRVNKDLTLSSASSFMVSSFGICMFSGRGSNCNDSGSWVFSNSRNVVVVREV